MALCPYEDALCPECEETYIGHGLYEYECCADPECCTEHEQE